MEGVRNGSLLLSVPTAWRFAKGSRCPLFLGKCRRPRSQHSLSLQLRSLRIALAIGKGLGSLRRERLNRKNRCPLSILVWILDMPASLPCGPLVPGAEGGTCISMAWLCIREEDSQGKIPRQTQVSPRGGGESYLFVCFGVGGWGGCHGNTA